MEKRCEKKMGTWSTQRCTRTAYWVVDGMLLCTQHAKWYERRGYTKRSMGAAD